ncbi:MAG: ADP-ribosyl-[dinitrogen reductase] hydrolase [Thermomicrobiales bacterium]|nr:ADP-ribosyl-[dinitrogen reductase] hydrolase [Thermomicrobiales bacterium]
MRDERSETEEPATDRLGDRYAGCLLGLACGDALGGPLEFVPRANVDRQYPDGLRTFVGGGWLHLAPGEITDDTQMTLALARSLAHCRHLDLDDLTARFLEWLNSNPKDVGGTTRSALRLLEEGVLWNEAGERVANGGRAAGNGSVMRCAPVALRYRGDGGALRRASLDTARMTHADPRCTWGAVAVNQAIATLLDGGTKEVVTDAALAGIEHAEVCDCVRGAASRPREEVRSGGFVLDTIGAAFWCLLRHETLEETIVAAVGLGDDADTTGAVAGALAGACYGAEEIPSRWLQLLQPRAELEDLAARLLARNLVG